MADKKDANVPTEGTDKNPVILFVETNIPELAGATDEEKFAAAAEFLEKQQAFNQKMAALFEADPTMGALIGNVMKGEKPFLQALGETISPEELTALMESEGGSALEAMNNRRSKLKEFDERESRIAGNADKSAENLLAWAQKKGLDEAKTDEFMNRYLELMGILADGVITDKEYDQLYNTLYFDDAMAAAREEGAIAGRNEQIDARRVEKEARKATDGLPALKGGGAPAGAQTPEQKGYFDDMLEQDAARRSRLKG